MVTTSGSCACGTPTPDDLSLCLHTGEWIELSFDVLQLLTGMELIFSGTAPQAPLDILLEYRTRHHEWHTVNVTTSNDDNTVEGFPLVRRQRDTLSLDLPS